MLGSSIAEVESVAARAELRPRSTLQTQSRISIALNARRRELMQAGGRGMLENRGGSLRSGFRDVAKSLTLIVVIDTCASDCFAAAARTGSVSLTEADEQVRSTPVPRRRNWLGVFEPAVGGDVLKVEYTIPAGSTVGVFAKAPREKPESGRPPPAKPRSSRTDEDDGPVLRISLLFLDARRARKLAVHRFRAACGERRVAKRSATRLL